MCFVSFYDVLYGFATNQAVFTPTSLFRNKHSHQHQHVSKGHLYQQTFAQKDVCTFTPRPFASKRSLQERSTTSGSNALTPCKGRRHCRRLLNSSVEHLYRSSITSVCEGKKKRIKTIAAPSCELLECVAETLEEACKAGPARRSHQWNKLCEDDFF